MNKEQILNELAKYGWDVIYDSVFGVITFDKSGSNFSFLVSFDMADGQILMRDMYDSPIWVSKEEMKLMIVYYEHCVYDN